MSSIQGALLLLGLFGLPLLLLVCNHRFRHLKFRMRGGFWGGVIGYLLGTIVWGIATIAPAQMWPQGSVRSYVIVLALSFCITAGFALGTLVGNRPKQQKKKQKQQALVTVAHTRQIK